MMVTGAVGLLDYEQKACQTKRRRKDVFRCVSGRRCTTSVRSRTKREAVSGATGPPCGRKKADASGGRGIRDTAVSYTHLRAHETDSYLVCRLLLEKKKK